jgi:hypothetical protein
VKIIFQTVKIYISLVPNTWDWYFTGIIPPGGNRVVNQSFYEFYEGKDAAY